MTGDSEQAGGSGAISYVRAAEIGELAGRLAARLGVSLPPPKPFVRSAGRRASRPAGDRVRVAAVTQSLDLEGAPKHLLDVTRGLSARGLDIALIAPRPGALGRAWEAAGITPTLARPPQQGARGARSYEAALATFVEQLRSLAPDVVLANTLTSFHAVDAARALGVPSVWAVHEGETPERFFAAYPRAVQARALGALAYPARTVFVSEATFSRWAPRGPASELIRTEPDPAAFAAIRARWTREAARAALGVRDDEIMVLSVGSICARKGQDLIAAAAPAILARHLATRLYCVGAAVGAEGEAIASSLAAAGTRLPGAVEDVALYYAAADVFLLPSRRESYPLVVLEAQAFGLPLVAAPVDGVPEQAGPDDALFFDAGDAQALAAALERLIADPSLRRTLALASGRRARARGAYGEMIDRYVALLGSVARG